MSNNDASTRDAAAAVENGGAVRAFEVLLAIGMVFMVIAAVAPLIGRAGFGWAGDTAPSVDAELDFEVDFGDRLVTRTTDDAVVDAATGQAPVEVGEPVTAHFVFPEPTPSQRVAWLVTQMVPPLLALAGTWLVFSMVRTARRGDPFVAENERRLWALAFLIGVGGTAWSLIGEFASMLVVQRSAAADMTRITATISFLPIVVGLGVGVLASVWHVGVGLRDDVEGMI
ncbi:MAG: DUF2975 domain-containing protein [Acidimicrobiales bacterium]